MASLSISRRSRNPRLENIATDSLLEVSAQGGSTGAFTTAR